MTGGSTKVSSMCLSLVMLAAAASLLATIPSETQAHGIARGQISISGDTQLTPERGVTGGSGSEADPYLIEGWEIIPTSGYGIEISMTRAHVVVRGVHVASETVGSQGGISIYQAQNVSIEDSTVSVRTDSYDMRSLVIRGSSHITVTNCSLDPRYGTPVLIDESVDVKVERCFIGAQGMGTIQFTGSSEFVVRGNTFYGFAGGIGIMESDHGEVYENDFWYCPWPVGLSLSNDIRFYHNGFFQYDPGSYWSLSLCYNITFDSGYPGGGNYYDSWNMTDKKSGPGQDLSGADGIADDPYVLGDVTDNYPLMASYVAPKHNGDYIELYPWISDTTVESPVEIGALPVDFAGRDRTGVQLTWSCNRTDCTIENYTGNTWPTVLFTAHDDGYFEVSVTDGNVTSYVSIHSSLGIAAIVIAPSTCTVVFGETVQLSATGYNSFGEVAIEPHWSTGTGDLVNETGVFNATIYDSSKIHNASSIEPYSITVSATQEGITGTAVVWISLNNTSDHDTDEMPDWWELRYGAYLDPFNSSDAAGDSDGDGCLNLEEYLDGTNPVSGDSDWDGMPDLWEKEYGFDPLSSSDRSLDPDGDGLSNYFEYVNHAAPNDPDTDDDGMPDGFEVNNGLKPVDGTDAGQDFDGDGLSNLEEYNGHTNPRYTDSDGDGLPDGWEVSHGLDPTSYSDGVADPDSDGLTNSQEFNIGTNMTDPDSDNDSIMDGAEVSLGMDPLNNSDANADWDSDGLVNLAEYRNGTNLYTADTDNDQLGDAFEVMFSHTSPLTWDSDGDGIGDAIEFLMNTGYRGVVSTLPSGWIGMTIAWGTYQISVQTNSTVLQGSFDKDTLSLSVSVGGPAGTRGAINMAVPVTLCNESDIALLLDGSPLEFTLERNDTHYLIHAEYSHSSHTLVAKLLRGGAEPGGPDNGWVLVVIVVGVGSAVVGMAFLMIRSRSRQRGKDRPPE